MQFLLRLMKLILGLFLCSFGIIIMICGGVGYSPWEVFHVGIAKSVGLSLGTITIGVGVGTLLCAFLLGPMLQGIFRITHFDPEEIRHEIIVDTWKSLRQWA